MQAMTFRTASSTQIMVTTLVASAFLIGLGSLMFWLAYQYRARPGGSQYIFIFSGCLMLLFFLGSLSFRIRSYEVEGGRLIVKTGFGKKEFDLKTLQSAVLVERPFHGGRRVLGVGGLWSMYGQFSSPSHGKFLAYATETSHGVMLNWMDAKVLVTPEDALQFIKTVQPGK